MPGMLLGQRTFCLTGIHFSCASRAVDGVGASPREGVLTETLKHVRRLNVDT